MRISVVTPSFNMGPYLEDTITSVVNNLRPGDEYFIVDGGSSDDSADVIRRHEQDITGWVSESDAGYADVLAQGHLVDTKVRRVRRPADVWYLARALLRPEGRRLSRAAPEMRRVLGLVSGMSPAQAAIAYVLSIPEISSCVVGTTDTRNLVEIIGASGKHLTAQDQARIWAAYQAMTEPLSA